MQQYNPSVAISKLHLGTMKRYIQPRLVSEGCSACRRMEETDSSLAGYIDRIDRRISRGTVCENVKRSAYKAAHAHLHDVPTPVATARSRSPITGKRINQ